MAINILETDEREYYEQIFKEFGKSKEDLDEYIDILRKWAETQPHFPEKPPYRVLRFVALYNKFSIELAKQRLDMYYSIRNIMPDMFRNHPLSPEMIEQSKITYVVPLPKVTNDFKRILFMQFNPGYSPEHFSHEKYMCHFVNVLDLLIEEDNCYNFHIIFDNKSLQMGHIAKMNPVIIKKAAILLEKVYSNRLASLYLVNFSTFVGQFLNNVVKPLLHPKIRKRLKVYDNSDILLQDFGKAIIPSDTGGEETSLSELNELLLKKFEEHRERYDELQSLKVDESLRPTKLVNDDILGYYGNFKKINFD